MIIIMKAKKLISRLKHPECVIFSERRHTDKSEFVGPEWRRYIVRKYYGWI